VIVSGHVAVTIGVAVGVVQRRFCPAGPLPSPARAGIEVVFARSAAVFFGFFTSRFDLFCPFAM